MEHKKRGWAWLLLAAMIVVPPALYVGAYYANATTTGAMWFAGGPGGRKVCPCPRYRVCESVSQTIFAPMHAIDRRLRPGARERPPEPWTPRRPVDPRDRADILSEF